MVPVAAAAVPPVTTTETVGPVALAPASSLPLGCLCWPVEAAGGDGGVGTTAGASGTVSAARSFLGGCPADAAAF
jgi:hypothetical protein